MNFQQKRKLQHAVKRGAKQRPIIFLTVESPKKRPVWTCINKYARTRCFFMTMNFYVHEKRRAKQRERAKYFRCGIYEPSCRGSNIAALRTAIRSPSDPFNTLIHPQGCLTAWVMIRTVYWASRSSCSPTIGRMSKYYSSISINSRLSWLSLPISH